MFPIRKLRELQPSQRRRKLILILTEIEISLRIKNERAFFGVKEAPSAGSPPPAYADPSAGTDAPRRNEAISDDLLSGLQFVTEDPKIPPEELTALLSAGEKLRDKANAPPEEKSPLQLRLCNLMRNALMRAAGTFPAEWDLIHPESSGTRVGCIKNETRAVSAGASLKTAAHRTAIQRPYHPGIYVFAEDIRSPFNIGSILRTAEAFGAEKVFFSPGCAPADHPRAVRSAMGCVELMDWEKSAMENLPSGLPLFALETGGTPIEDFAFPERGIVVVGSEELGVSPEALEKTVGRVSIPMQGVKASLNVGVAFGILMEAWTRSVRTAHKDPPAHVNPSAPIRDEG